MGAWSWRGRGRLVGALLAVGAASAGAQTLPAESVTAVAARPAVRDALAYLERSEAETLADQVALCEIPAPPFDERARAEAFRDRLRALGFADARIDAEGNVLAVWGDGARPIVVLSGHLDTVFPRGTDVRVRREGQVFRGPGIGDDCRGLAVVLAVARAMRRFDLRPRGTVVFVGTVGEEGPGNLRGVRHLVDRELPGRLDAFLSVDGAGWAVTKDAVGSVRLKVRYHGPGGHSWGAFGMPNPIHALGRAIAALADLRVPDRPRTTFNVGVIGGGTSVNSIAQEAWAEIDLRSESPDTLSAMERRVRQLLQAALAAERARWPRSTVPLALSVDTLGFRPAARQPVEAPWVQAAIAAARAVGGETPPLRAGSTDANWPLHRGIPALTITGGGRGSGAHSEAETFEAVESHRGPQWALLLVGALVGLR